MILRGIDVFQNASGPTRRIKATSVVDGGGGFTKDAPRVKGESREKDRISSRISSDRAGDTWRAAAESFQGFERSSPRLR